MNWRLYWSITTSNYEIKEFRSAISNSSLNAHQRDASVWRKQKILKSLLSVGTESEDNSIVALPCESCGELCPPDKLMERQEQFIQEREGVHRSGSASEKERSYSLPVLETPLGSVEQRERRWPLHFCEFYNGRSPLWSHSKHFPRPVKIVDGHLK